MVVYDDSNDLFSSKADALVNPVNCVGFMGRGLAKEFKKRFPECFEPYVRACKERKLIPGRLMFIRLQIEPDLFKPSRPAVILFPTKDHWRGKSHIDWIKQGLTFLRSRYAEWELSSVAMPRIGCGLGGLDWESVRPLIHDAFDTEKLEVIVYMNSSKTELLEKHSGHKSGGASQAFGASDSK